MTKDEFQVTNSNLKEVLKTEENMYFKDKEERNFYFAHKIDPTPYLFTNFYHEYFYVIFQIDDYAIYYNDIEEDFGVCKIESDQCDLNTEFCDANLAPTVRRFKKALEEDAMETLFA